MSSNGQHTEELRFAAVIYFDPEVKSYWAEVPGVRGTYTQADTLDEIRENLVKLIPVMIEESNEEPIDMGNDQLIGAEVILIKQPVAAK